MIYKVFYQASNDEVPVREKTDSIFVEAQSERGKLNQHANNIHVTIDGFII
ncbi:DUF1447 family protein [Bacillus licheniformis]|nr:DUF1447 family protein [Bacillus licheniformis]